MPTPPQRHPSRDVYKKPPEYELPGVGGVNFIPGGHYDSADIAGATQYWKDEGADVDPAVKAESGGILNPAQGRLFDPDKHEAAQRQKLGRQRFEADTPTAEGIRDRALQSSRIPTSHLQSRGNRMETKLTTSNNDRPWAGSGAAGWYNGPAGSLTRDTIAVDPRGSAGGGSISKATDTTMIHEMGHRRQLGERLRGFDLTHPRMLNPDPMKEGAADSYVDRYGGPDSSYVRPMREDIEAGGGQKFTSYQFTGYSTNHPWETPGDKAVYAATRAHGSETGEMPEYVPQGRHVMEQPGLANRGGGDPTIDATLHSLLSTSPHAAQALRQTGLKDVGAEAFRRHRDRQLLTQGQSVQESLFNEIRGVNSRKLLGYSPSYDAAGEHVDFEQHFDQFHEHMTRLEEEHGEIAWPMTMSKNQFGEKPRSQADVNETLGVSRHHAKRMGFTST